MKTRNRKIQLEFGKNAEKSGIVKKIKESIKGIAKNPVLYPSLLYLQRWREDNWSVFRDAFKAYSATEMTEFFEKYAIKIYQTKQRNPLFSPVQW